MPDFIVRHKDFGWAVRLPIDNATCRRIGIDVNTGRPFRFTNEVPRQVRARERTELCTRTVLKRSRHPVCHPDEIRDLKFSDLKIRRMRQGALAQFWRNINGYN